jgi:hypothetical protein
MRGQKEPEKKMAPESPPGPAVLSALAWLSLVGLLLSRARLCFARPVHPTHFLPAEPEVKQVTGRQNVSAAVLNTVRGRNLTLGFGNDLPARRLARTTIHELRRTRLSGIV